MTKALIIGMGIGQLYQKVFTELKYEIETVDILHKATYKDAADAKGNYDIAVICTPNFTHEEIARTIASKCKIVLIEKPGLQDSKCWQCLVEDFPDTRFMMVKNNQYRKEISKYKRLAEASDRVQAIWNSRDRIPFPGGWFTTKEKAFGGVSRDLLPHLLSYYTVLTDYKNSTRLFGHAIQRHQLKDITRTDYGNVNPNGTYDVDDFAELEYKNGDCLWVMSSNWKDGVNDDIFLSFSMKNSAVKESLGLCPEEAYKTMIETAVKNVDKNAFWEDQYDQDIWIHKQLEKL
jgi:predicted dehydrogenase